MNAQPTYFEETKFRPIICALSKEGFLSCHTRTPRLFASYDNLGALKTYSNPDPRGFFKKGIMKLLFLFRFELGSISVMRVKWKQS